MNKNSVYYAFAGFFVGFNVAVVLVLVSMQVNRVCVLHTELVKRGCGEFDVETGEFVFTGCDVNHDSVQATE